jgi:hypothetical protein
MAENWPACNLTPCQGEIQPPFINWKMAEEAVFWQLPERKHPWLIMEASHIQEIVREGGAVFNGTGKIVVNEGSVFAELVFLSVDGKIKACDDQLGMPTLSGPGVQEFLDWLAGYAN